VAEEESAPDHTQEAPPTPRRPRIRRGGADEVRAAQFPAAMRGYDRAAVDSWQQEIADLVERLEDQQPRDAAVKRALDEVGQETTAILQRAHEAAEEITARSRSQADGRLRRAETEADTVIRESDERAEQLEHDARRIWDERQRLIEEMRALADEVLGVADDALDRVEAPPGRTPEQPEQRVLDAGEDAEDAEEADGPVTTVDYDGSVTTAEGPGPPAADPPTRVEPPARPPVDVAEQATVESPAARPDATPRSGSA